MGGPAGSGDIILLDMYIVIFHNFSGQSVRFVIGKFIKVQGVVLAEIGIPRELERLHALLSC